MGVPRRKAWRGRRRHGTTVGGSVSGGVGDVHAGVTPVSMARTDADEPHIHTPGERK
ncbi:hypothetical protein [Halogranum amylolyticum]|uniref:hypothetical protein n=1 Tax=Halogranum amylolyticum TaxID=660520 RepID=UPI00147EC24F|nr:hypothetical protein [Halogranum amylolyticum]